MHRLNTGQISIQSQAVIKAGPYGGGGGGGGGGVALNVNLTHDPSPKSSALGLTIESPLL